MGRVNHHSKNVKLIWTDLQGNKTTLAESTNGYYAAEGLYYIDPKSFKVPLENTSTPYTCPWKGKAQYHSITPPGAKHPIKDRMWSYPQPKEEAKDLAGYVAFYPDAGRKQDVGGEWHMVLE